METATTSVRRHQQAGSVVVGRDMNWTLTERHASVGHVSVKFRVHLPGSLLIFIFRVYFPSDWMFTSIHLPINMCECLLICLSVGTTSSVCMYVCQMTDMYVFFKAVNSSRIH